MLSFLPLKTPTGSVAGLLRIEDGVCTLSLRQPFSGECTLLLTSGAAASVRSDAPVSAPQRTLPDRAARTAPRASAGGVTDTQGLQAVSIQPGARIHVDTPVVAAVGTLHGAPAFFGAVDGCPFPLSDLLYRLSLQKPAAEPNPSAPRSSDAAEPAPSAVRSSDEDAPRHDAPSASWAEDNETDRIRPDIPLTGKAVATGGNRTPVSHLEDANAADRNRTPVSHVEDAHAAHGNRTPVSHLEDANAADGNRAPVSHVEDAHAAHGNRAPVSHLEDAIAADGNRTPVSRKEEADAAGGNRTPVSHLEDAHAADGNRAPALHREVAETAVKNRLAAADVAEIIATERRAHTGGAACDGTRVTVYGARDDGHAADTRQESLRDPHDAARTENASFAATLRRAERVYADALCDPLAPSCVADPHHGSADEPRLSDAHRSLIAHARVAHADETGVPPTVCRCRKPAATRAAPSPWTAEVDALLRDNQR